jgi:hypothetical protein
MHERTEEIHGEAWQVSHGDATSSNVLVDLERSEAGGNPVDHAGEAIWFDFDMRHCWKLPARQRQADDLRALIYSSAVAVACNDYQDFAATVAQALKKAPPVALAFCQRIKSDWQQPTVFHLAQAPLPFAAQSELSRLLVAALSEQRAILPPNKITDEIERSG